VPRVRRRPLAEADIAEIWDYIAEDSIEQADAWVDPDSLLMALDSAHLEPRRWGATHESERSDAP
jgi:plasmid stabilization system protein ParE